MADATDGIARDVSLDSTIVRAHQPATGAPAMVRQRVEPAGSVTPEPPDHAFEWSRS